MYQVRPPVSRGHSIRGYNKDCPRREYNKDCPRRSTRGLPSLPARSGLGRWEGATRTVPARMANSTLYCRPGLHFPVQIPPKATQQGPAMPGAGDHPSSDPVSFGIAPESLAAHSMTGFPRQALPAWGPTAGRRAQPQRGPATKGTCSNQHRYRDEFTRCGQ